MIAYSLFRPNRRSFVVATIAISLLAMSPAALHAQDMPTIRLGTQPYPGEANIFVALTKGMFEEAGVKVEASQLQSGRLTMDAMLSGSLDIATPVETGPMFAIANGTNLAIIAQASTNPEEIKPVVRIDSNVKGPKDLAGKRLGFGAGSSNQFAMYNWLKAGNIPAADATLVNLQPADLVTALVAGDIDVAFTWEPFLTAAVIKGGGRTKVIEGQNLYQSRLLFVSRTAWAAENKEGIARFLKALIKAGDWIAKNRDEAMQITAKEIGMDPMALDPIFHRWKFDVSLPKGLLDAFNAQFDWAAEAGLLPAGTERPNYADSFFADSLESVKADAVTYKTK